MATSSSPTSKINSLHRLSNIFQLTSPSFSRTSFDPQPQRNRLTRNRLSPKPSPTRAHHSQTTSISSSVTLGTHDRDNTLAQTASILSSSTLASSHTPLLDSEPPKSPGPVLPVPPTTNDLAAEEKMKLVKKSRKISRVLGEVPVPSTTDDMPELYSPKRLSDVPEDPSSSSRPTSPTLNIQTVSASAKKAFRRSMTFGAGSLQVPEVQRSKSTSALRPALQLSTAVPGDEHEHSYSPILFAANEAASDDDAENMEDVIPPSVIDAPEDDADSSESSSPAQTAHADSNSPYGLSVEETRERIQRQRMDRLARILGEGVPPDVLRRAASPSPKDASASPMYHAGDASRGMSMEHLPQRSTSLRAKKNPRRKRPQSLDFKNIRNSGALSAPVTPLDSPSGLSSPGIRRAMSTQARISGTAPITDSVPSQNVEVDGPSAEKQRILNVKRAKKLTQLFGDNPPTALFQITNFGSVIESGDLLDAANSDIHRHQRDSLATIISISSLSGDASLRLRDSFISVVTSNSDISAAILTSEVEGEPGTIPEVSETAEGPTMAQPEESEPTEAPSKSLDIPVVVAPAPLGANVKRSSSSPYPARPPSPNPQARSKLNVTAYPFQPPRTPPTPPPFSNFILSPSSTENFMAPRLDTTVEPAAHAKPSSDDFRARRRRAAKLSRFFGVEVNTLVDHLPNETSPLRSSRNGPYHFPQDPLPVHPGAVYGHSAGIPSVTVAQARGRYADQDDVEELDMSEVIDKLRKMKSS